ncbi:MAG: crossover junction endodeoxyribonuclease RuvC [Fimbriimonadaceae bacterium]|nr:crossover junction endodeoxyribonuclease RuvC [Fimbriimonadaceae bacterium]
MRILGIDPGLERIGWALVLREGSRLTAIEYGLIQTPRVELPERLRMVHEQACELFDRTAPDALATERQLFAANKTTALLVAHALGVVLLAASERGLEWAEYAPPEIKQAVVGNGSADKKQVQFMVQRLLSLKETPKPDDVADALAIAICHAMRSRVSGL